MRPLAGHSWLMHDDAAQTPLVEIQDRIDALYDDPATPAALKELLFLLTALRFRLP